MLKTSRLGHSLNSELKSRKALGKTKKKRHPGKTEAQMECPAKPASPLTLQAKRPRLQGDLMLESEKYGGIMGTLGRYSDSRSAKEL
jgi:hypothetical protein